MERSICLIVLLAGSALADQSSYGAPSASSGYTSPSGGYDAQGYDYGGYGATASGDTGIDDIGGKLEELIPLFIAVFAAIILAQLLGPLLNGVLALVVALVPGALSLKAPIINAILAPFGLQLCTTAVPPVAFAGRSLADQARGFGYDLSDDQVVILSDFVLGAVDKMKEMLV